MVAKLTRLSPARLKRLMNKIQHLEEKLPPLLRVKILKGFAMLFGLGHWMCCAWRCAGGGGDTPTTHGRMQ